MGAHRHRSPPIRLRSPDEKHEGSPKSKHEGRMEAHPVAAAHPSDSGAQNEGAEWEPSPVAAAHPSDPAPQTGNMKGAQKKNMKGAIDEGSPMGAHPVAET